MSSYKHRVAGCFGFKLQMHRPLLTPYSKNRIPSTRQPQIQIPYVCPFVTSSLESLALCKSVIKDKNILCEIYVDTYSDVK